MFEPEPEQKSDTREQPHLLVFDSYLLYLFMNKDTVINDGYSTQ